MVFLILWKRYLRFNRPSTQARSQHVSPTRRTLRPCNACRVYHAPFTSLEKFPIIERKCYSTFKHLMAERLA